MLVASWFIGMCLNIIVYCFLFCKFTGVEKFRINYKVILFCMLSCISYYIFLKLNIVIPRPLFIHCIIFCGLFLTYRCSIVKTLITELCIFVLFSISEIIYGFIMIFIFNINVKNFVSFPKGYLFTNFIIIVFVILISRLSGVKRFINYILKWLETNKNKSSFFFAFCCLIIFMYFLYNNFISVLPKTILWFTNLFAFVVTYFILSYFKEKSSNNRIISEYEQLLKYVQKYERIVDEKSKNQHEYKNQLAILKSLINKNNKKAINYIEELNMDFKDNNDANLLGKLKHLPSGGLKGLIYYKIEEMFDKSINVFIDVSSEVENTNLDVKINDNLKDISKVFGVYIDNAIEACLESSEKYIILEFYTEDDNLVFSISNTYSNLFDINKVEEAGYTTKGDGKGYGLSLVKDILNNNVSLNSEKSLNGIYYVQKLYIKNRV